MYSYLKDIPQGNHKNLLIERLFPSYSFNRMFSNFPFEKMKKVINLLIYVELRTLKQIAAHPESDANHESEVEDLYKKWDQIISDFENAKTLKRASDNKAKIKGGTFRDLLFAITAKDMCSE